MLQSTSVNIGKKLGLKSAKGSRVQGSTKKKLPTKLPAKSTTEISTRNNPRLPPITTTPITLKTSILKD